MEDLTLDKNRRLRFIDLLSDPPKRTIDLEVREDWSPEQFIESIDLLFIYCKRNKYSRYGVEWGKPSREMNLVLRERIANKTLFSGAYENVGLYWIVKSQILEFLYKSRFLHVGKRRKLEKEAKHIKEQIYFPKAERGEDFEKV